eukprot:scaffold221401_cov48-Attheya_sp.AAC.2
MSESLYTFKVLRSMNCFLKLSIIPGHFGDPGELTSEEDNDFDTSLNNHGVEHKCMYRQEAQSRLENRMVDLATTAMCATMKEMEAFLYIQQCYLEYCCNMELWEGPPPVYAYGCNRDSSMKMMNSALWLRSYKSQHSNLEGQF